MIGACDHVRGNLAHRLKFPCIDEIVPISGDGVHRDRRQLPAEIHHAHRWRDEQRAETLRRLYEARGYRFRPPQDRMADRPRGSSWIANPVGAAAGISLSHGKVRLFALPGVPQEMKPMSRPVMP